MLPKAAWTLLVLIPATIPASPAMAASGPQGGFSLQCKFQA